MLKSFLGANQYIQYAMRVDFLAHEDNESL